MEISSRYMYVNLILYPVISLGPGKRVGIWTQGCSIQCEGCMSKHTWDKNKKYLTHIDEICKKVLSYKSNNLTISGGEPFDQPRALFTFLNYVREYFEDILIYSGYKYEYLQQNYPYILKKIDVLIDGSFDISQPTNKIYKGSENQRIFLFNKSLINKYTLFITKTQRNIQFLKKDKNLFIIGVPHINDFQKIQNNLKGEI